MSFIDKLKQAKERIGRGLLSEKVPEDKAIRDHRINTCNSCPELLKTRQCRKCGCFVDAKTKLRNEACPLKKW